MSVSAKGKIISPEARIKIGAAFRGKTLSPEHRAKLRTARARQVPSYRDTKPELAVQTLLRDCGIEFTKHSHIQGLLHQWDIKIESLRVLVEVDGCYWHGCPCRLGKSRINKNDIPCAAYAVAAGWTVIRIRECEIRKNDFSKLVRITGVPDAGTQKLKGELLCQR